jgi:hypothetical protein
MSDDRKEEGAPASSGEHKQDPDGEPDANTQVETNPHFIGRYSPPQLAQFAADSRFTAQADVLTYPRRLLTMARSLIDQGEPSIAVVVAHMACEVATERRMSEAFVTKQVEYLKDAVTSFLNGYSIALNKRTRDLYITLTGDKVQQTLFWPNFKKSARRRNHIIHQGQIVGAVQAEESYNAASDFLTHLKF